MTTTTRNILTTNKKNRNMNLKTAQRIVHLQEQNQGFRATNLSEQLGSIDPFIILTDFFMPKAFFPPHPHAGFSVLNSMFLNSEGAFINRDSLGDRNRIEPGAIHLTQAGKGILHEEIPEVEGQMCHGLQMWMNHSSQDRFVVPKAMHVSKSDVSEIIENGNLIRVLLGKHNNTKATIKPIPATTLLDVHLIPNTNFTHIVEDGHVSFIFMIAGKAKFEDNNLELHSCVKFSDDGNTIEIKTENDNAHFLLATGKPFNEETLFGGPFVMSNEEQMHKTRLSYGKGEMGHLEPSEIFKKIRI
jgi:quercetin 2,3-dioxygenase